MVQFSAAQYCVEQSSVNLSGVASTTQQMTLPGYGRPVCLGSVCMSVGGDVVFEFLNSTKAVCFLKQGFGAVLKALSHSKEPSNASL